MFDPSLKTGLDELPELCRATDRLLWQAFFNSSKEPFDLTAPSKLIFPKYGRRTPVKLRVSEQEARFAFVESLRDRPFLYSVETPTLESYQLTGSKPLSAQSDLTLYYPTGEQICNVEFKSKGASPQAKSHFSIVKDLEKLLREGVNGLWFHLLESVNNTTIPNLIKVIATGLETVRLETFRKDSNKQIKSPQLVIHVCVLEPGFSMHRAFSLSANHVPSATEIWDEDRMSLTVSRSELLEAKGQGQWIFHRSDGRVSK